MINKPHGSAPWAWALLTPRQQGAMTKLAACTMGMPTLESRKSDALDFHDVAVWSAREALAKAFLAGAGQIMP